MTTGDTFLTLYSAVQGKLKDSSSATTTRVKVEVNNAVKEIARKFEFRFLIDKDNVIPGTGARSYTISDSDFGDITDLRVGTAAQVGDTTTQWLVTNPVGTTFRYQYTGTGDDPHVGLMFHEVGDYLTASGFVAGTGANNVTNYAITGVGANYVEITHGTGTVETITGATVLINSKNNAVPTRRSTRSATAQQATGLVQTNLVQGITSWNTTLTDNPYSYVDQTTIQFKLPITTSQVIWFDYMKNVSTMTGDTETCIIPSGQSDVVIQLAFANMLEVDDDTRSVAAYQKYLILLNDMKKRYAFSSDIDDTMQMGGYRDS